MTLVVPSSTIPNIPARVISLFTGNANNIQSVFAAVDPGMYWLALTVQATGLNAASATITSQIVLDSGGISAVELAAVGTNVNSLVSGSFIALGIGTNTYMYYLNFDATFGHSMPIWVPGSLAFSYAPGTVTSGTLDIRLLVARA